MRIFFIYAPQLNEDGVSAYMDLDTTFGVKIAGVCAALDWRVRDWTFFFGPYEDAQYRTPRDCEMNDEDEVKIFCVPALENN